MKLNFVKQDKKYVAEFAPTSGGALLVNQEKGGDLFVYIYTDGVDKILVDKDVTRRTDYIKMLDFTDVVVRLESTTPIKNAGYAGEGTIVPIKGKGEFGLMKTILTINEETGDVDISLEYGLNCFNLGDTIHFIARSEFDASYDIVLVHESQLERFTSICLTLPFGYTQCVPADSAFLSIEDLGFDEFGLEFPEELRGYYFINPEFFVFYGVEIIPYGGKITIYYDGNPYVYNNKNFIIEQ